MTQVFGSATLPQEAFVLIVWLFTIFGGVSAIALCLSPKAPQDKAAIRFRVWVLLACLGWIAIWTIASFESGRFAAILNLAPVFLLKRLLHRE